MWNNDTCGCVPPAHCVTVLAHDEQIPSLVCECVLFPPSSGFPWAGHWVPHREAKPSLTLTWGRAPIPSGGHRGHSVHPKTQTLCVHLCHCSGSSCSWNQGPPPKGSATPSPWHFVFGHGHSQFCLVAVPQGRAWSPLQDAFLAVHHSCWTFYLNPRKFWCKAPLGG